MHKQYLPKNPFFVVPAIILGVIAIVAILEITNTTHLLHKAHPISGSAYTKGETKSTTNNQTTKTSATNGGSDITSDSTQPGDQKSNDGGTATTTLLAPSGDFVSNHHPNLSNSPAPNTVSSVCTTTPGATCTISFTKDSTTKSLDAETTDRGGSAYWNWKLQDVGLSEGTWSIQAIATFNGQTKSASDALSLVVTQ